MGTLRTLVNGAGAICLPVSLREAIADYVSRARGTSCVADQVVVVAGAQQGLEMISRLLLDPGDVVWMEDPGYPGARGALMAAGAHMHGLDSDGRVIYVGSFSKTLFPAG